ncbi:PAS domain S-box protein, partial [candidate division KSB1 bacterium]
KEAAEKFKKDDKKVMKSRKQTVIEEEITNAKGDTVYLETIKSPILDETGNVTGTVGIARDITGRKQTEEELQDYRHRLEEMVAIRTVDLEEVNEQLKNDITDRKKAEEELQKSEERYRSITQTAVDAIISTDENGKIVEWNEGAQSIFGYSEKEVLNKLITILIPDRYRQKHKSGLKHFVKTRKPKLLGKTIELSGLRKDGSEFPIELTLSCWESGGDVYFTSIIRDITRRKDVEEGREKLLKAIETTKEAISITTPDIEMIYTNDAMDELFGYETGELIGKHVSILFTDPLSKAMKMIKQIANVVKKKSFWEGEIHSKRKDGTEFISHVEITALTDDNGKIINYISTQNDITEQKKAEEALRESEKKFREMADLLPEIVFEMDLNGVLTYVNQKSYEMSGYTEKEFNKGFTAVNFLIQSDRQKAVENIKKVLKGKSDINIRYTAQHKDGHTFPIMTRSVPIIKEGMPVGLRGIIFDMSELELYEKSLKESEEKFRMLSEQSLMGMVILQEGEIKYTNQATADMAEYSIEEIEKWNAYDFMNNIHSDDREKVFEQVLKKQAGEEDVIPQYSCRMITKTGKTKWIENYSKTILYKGKNAIFITILDITERKKAEEALREANNIINRSPAVAFTWRNQEGWPVGFVSKNVEKLFGYKAEKFISGEVSYASCVHPDDLARVGKEVEKFSRDKRRREFVHEPYRIVTKDGLTKIISDWTFIERNEEGEITHYKGVVQDITERKKVEEALRESEERLNEAQRVAHVGSWELDIKTHELWWSDETYRMFGFEKGEFGNTMEAFFRTVHPDDQPLMQNVTEAAWYDRKPFNADHRIILPSGEIRTVHEQAEVIFDDSGQPVRMIGTVQDITDRKKAEEALRESEEKYRTIFEQFIDLYYQTDMDGIIKNLSPSVKLLTGYTPEELIGHSVLEVYYNLSDRDNFIRELKKKDHVENYELKLVKKNGEVVDVSINAHIVFGEDKKPILIEGVIHNITERKKAEEEIKRKNLELNTFINSIPDMAWFKDTNSNFIIVNKAFGKTVGMDPEYLVNNTCEVCFGKEAAKKFKEDDQKVISGGKRIVFEESIVDTKGNKIYLETIKSPFFDESGKVLGTIGIARNINERKKVEERLKESEERYRDLFENASDMIQSVGLDGTILYVNNAWKKTLGYTDEEISNLRLSDIIHPDSREHCNQVFQKVISEIPVSNIEAAFITKTGKKILVEGSANCKMENGKPVSTRGIFHNVTERKKAEDERNKLQEQLFQSQKMESMGRLAGAVAHDLNHVLTGLVTYPDILLLDMEKSDPLREKIENIKKSGQRAAAIVEDLLSIARGGIENTESLNINSVIIDCIDSPEIKQIKRYNPDIIFDIELEPFLNNIISSEIHLSKILHNLINNAAEAMPSGGKILISTSNKKIKKTISGYENIPKGEYILLCVSDTGKGIPKKDLTRIFEPYYTKKKFKKFVTGIGLTVVWNITKEHNGFIGVKSEVGSGTVFYIYLPITKEKTEQNDNIRIMEEYVGNNEAVLIIDDDEGLRNIGMELLKILKYSPIAVSSGEEAVEYLKNNKVDLILLDMLLGDGMDGLDTYKEIIKIDPDQKVIIISGFSASDKIKETQRLGAGDLVNKPFTIEEIGLAIKKELNK